MPSLCVSGCGIYKTQTFVNIDNIINIIVCVKKNLTKMFHCMYTTKFKRHSKKVQLKGRNSPITNSVDHFDYSCIILTLNFK